MICADCGMDFTKNPDGCHGRGEDECRPVESPRSPGGYAARSAGQIDYEADVEKAPTYHDGAPRKQWHELSDVAQWSWERRAK